MWQGGWLLLCFFFFVSTSSTFRSDGQQNRWQRKHSITADHFCCRFCSSIGTQGNVTLLNKVGSMIQWHVINVKCAVCKSQMHWSMIWYAKTPLDHTKCTHSRDITMAHQQITIDNIYTDQNERAIYVDFFVQFLKEGNPLSLNFRFCFIFILWNTKF